MQRASRFLVVSFVGALALSCGKPQTSAREKTATGTSAVQGGQSDTTHGFMVGLAMTDDSLCSGTLIAPNLVLTARHCIATDTGGDAVDCAVAKFRPPMKASEVFVTTDDTMAQSSKYYGVKSIEVPTATPFCGNDIALLVLDTNVPASAATPATPVVQFQMTDRSKVGTTMVATGYGITGPALDDAGRRRMRRSVSVQCIPGDAQIDCPPDETESPNEFITQGWVCEGDSGGGAYDQKSFDQGTPYVMGVLSRAYDSSNTCADATYTRTDAHSQLIIDAAKKAADEGGYPYPEWTGLTKAPEQDAGGGAEAPGQSADPAGDGGAGATKPTGGVVTTTTTGCSASSGPSNGSSLAATLVVLVAFTARRRRRD